MPHSLAEPPSGGPTPRERPGSASTDIGLPTTGVTGEPGALSSAGGQSTRAARSASACEGRPRSRVHPSHDSRDRPGSWGPRVAPSTGFDHRARRTGRSRGGDLLRRPSDPDGQGRSPQLVRSRRSIRRRPSRHPRTPLVAVLLPEPHLIQRAIEVAHRRLIAGRDDPRDAREERPLERVGNPNRGRRRWGWRRRRHQGGWPAARKAASRASKQTRKHAVRRSGGPAGQPLGGAPGEPRCASGGRRRRRRTAHAPPSTREARGGLWRAQRKPTPQPRAP